MRAKAKRSKVPHVSEASVAVWCERDRQHVSVTVDDGQRTVAEWWDDDVTDMIESGFFDVSGFIMGRDMRPGRLDASVLDYCVSVGLLEGGAA